VRGKINGKTRIGDGVLDIRQGGHVTFDHRPAFDASGRFTAECWVKLDKEGQSPVVISCGLWEDRGWFIQRIGSGWRWFVAGIHCDGGVPALGRWTHLVATLDDQTARLYQDGKKVAEATGQPNRTPWDGALHIGQYSGDVADRYQVNGWIAGVKIYNRSLSEEDAAAGYLNKPRMN
jgi:hypothetical protein